MHKTSAAHHAVSMEHVMASTTFGAIPVKGRARWTAIGACSIPCRSASSGVDLWARDQIRGGDQHCRDFERDRSAFGQVRAGPTEFRTARPLRAHIGARARTTRQGSATEDREDGGGEGPRFAEFEPFKILNFGRVRRAASSPQAARRVVKGRPLCRRKPRRRSGRRPVATVGRVPSHTVRGFDPQMWGRSEFGASSTNFGAALTRLGAVSTKFWAGSTKSGDSMFLSMPPSVGRTRPTGTQEVLMGRFPQLFSNASTTSHFRGSRDVRRMQLQGDCNAYAPANGLYKALKIKRASRAGRIPWLVDVVALGTSIQRCVKSKADAVPTSGTACATT